MLPTRMRNGAALIDAVFDVRTRLAYILTQAPHTVASDPRKDAVGRMAGTVACAPRTKAHENDIETLSPVEWAGPPDVRAAARGDGAR